MIKKIKTKNDSRPAGRPADELNPWHAASAEEVYRRLRSSPDGLTEVQAYERLREFGQNILPGKKPPSLLQVILHQFLSPLIYILLIAGVVAISIGDVKDALFIFGVVLLNSAIGTVQEYRAEQSAHALQRLLRIHGRVRRDSEIKMKPAEDIVPGDFTLIESGDKVPADIRLTKTSNLSIDESFLTGESLPVQKKITLLDPDTPVADWENMAFAGATVISGRGSGPVVATGSHTEVGKIARSITEREGAEAPLVIRMRRFAREISIVVLVFAVLLGALSWYRGEPFKEVFFTMVAMVVSAIPEGLPVAMTVALSLATARMAKRKVIARKLVAVESLGSCTTIASDKTGTLTVNEQTAKIIKLHAHERLAVSGQGYTGEGVVQHEHGGDIGSESPGVLNDRLLEIARAAVLCNEGALTRTDNGWQHSGDPMDVALLALAYKIGVDPEEQRRGVSLLDDIPFESEKRYSAVAYSEPGSPIVVAKGAIESIVRFCSHMRGLQGDVPLNSDEIQEQAQKLAEDGYRVLAISARQGSQDEDLEHLEESYLQGMVLLGLVGFIDPLRPEARDAVARAADAGVKVVMVTGDHPATALAIGRQLGLAQSTRQLMTGREIQESLDSDTPEFHERLRETRVFARVTPQQKVYIVDSLMELGEFVAVTGDGVNDAPALNRANIGVAMGSGTDVAKDSAQIILTDDNFASIVGGIEEGRFAYSNVRKVTLLLISTGFAELVLIGLAVIAGLPRPFMAVQILWLNLVTNGIQDVALAFEPGEERVMKLPPRQPQEGVFNRRMIEQVLVGGLTMALVCLLAWIYMVNDTFEIGEARNLLLTLLILMQFYHVLNSRSEHDSAFRIPFRKNPVLIAGMVAAFSIHFISMHVPFMQSLLGVGSLSLREWLILAGLASSVMFAMETYKWIVRDRQE